MSNSEDRRPLTHDILVAFLTACFVGGLSNAGIWYQLHESKRNIMLQEKQRIHGEFAQARRKYVAVAFALCDCDFDTAMDDLISEVSDGKQGSPHRHSEKDREDLYRALVQEDTVVTAILDTANTHFATKVRSDIEAFYDLDYPIATLETSTYKPKLYEVEDQGWYYKDNPAYRAVYSQISSNWYGTFGGCDQFQVLRRIEAAMEEEINASR